MLPHLWAIFPVGEPQQAGPCLAALLSWLNCSKAAIQQGTLLAECLNQGAGGGLCCSVCACVWKSFASRVNTEDSTNTAARSAAVSGKASSSVAASEWTEE